MRISFIGPIAMRSHAIVTDFANLTVRMKGVYPSTVTVWADLEV